jgi:hypothetical protein
VRSPVTFGNSDFSVIREESEVLRMRAVSIHDTINREMKVI